MNCKKCHGRGWYAEVRFTQPSVVSNSNQTPTDIPSKNAIAVICDCGAYYKRKKWIVDEEISNFNKDSL